MLAMYCYYNHNGDFVALETIKRLLLVSVIAEFLGQMFI